jgi:hypothetical protein
MKKSKNESKVQRELGYNFEIETQSIFTNRPHIKKEKNHIDAIEDQEITL